MERITPLSKNDFELPPSSSVRATGFESPAEGYVDNGLSLSDKLIQHEHATFYFEFEGEAMKEAGILNKDIIVVDRALDAKNNSIVLAVINNEMIVRYYTKLYGKKALVASNKNYRSILLTEETDFEIFGVVTGSITLL